MSTPDTTISFDATRWEKVKTDAAAWWAGTLERPLVLLRAHGYDAPRAPAKHPFHQFTALYGLNISAEDVVDAWDWSLARTRYYGDAFPVIWPNFGPGVLAAFLGARLEAAPSTVWFSVEDPQPVTELSFRLDWANPWIKRVQALMEAATRRWQGLVQVGMTDLGGALDVLSTFRPGEELLLDLYDEPEAVLARIGEIHERWFQAFAHLDACLRPCNPGYSAWAGLYSSEPHYMLQSDFCYMIGPEMFDRFVKPELAAACKKLVNPFYHLDGPGQLPHLDSLLEIPELKGVQWIPGAGQKGFDEWPEVYRKIRGAGKLTQFFGGWDGERCVALDNLVEQLGSGAGLLAIIHTHADQLNEDTALRYLERYGAV